MRRRLAKKLELGNWYINEYNKLVNLMEEFYYKTKVSCGNSSGFGNHWRTFNFKAFVGSDLHIYSKTGFKRLFELKGLDFELPKPKIIPRVIRKQVKGPIKEGDYFIACTSAYVDYNTKLSLKAERLVMFGDKKYKFIENRDSYDVIIEQNISLTLFELTAKDKRQYWPVLIGKKDDI